MPSYSSRTDESTSRLTNTNYKGGAPERASTDRYARGSSGIPISIKFKKLVHEDSRQQEREHPRKDRLQLELGKSTREAPPIEIGPKRLKVKGPSFLGSESRLD